MTPDEVRAVIDTLAREVDTRPDVSLPATRNLEPNGQPVELWGGGGVAVFDLHPGVVPPEDDPWGRAASCSLVVTPHAAAVADLLMALYHGFDGVVFHWNKAQLLGRLADAVLRYQDGHPSVETESGILGAMLDEVREMVAEAEAEAAQAAAMAPMIEARARAARVAADRRAELQWVRAGLPLPAEPGSFHFTPRAGVAFDRWAASADMLGPEPFEFENGAPQLVDVHRHGDMWVAVGEPTAWPEMPDDIGGGIWVPVDVVPGEWGRRVEVGDGQ